LLLMKACKEAISFSLSFCGSCKLFIFLCHNQVLHIIVS
jgi:hypothetical protein